MADKKQNKKDEHEDNLEAVNMSLKQKYARILRNDIVHYRPLEMFKWDDLNDNNIMVYDTKLNFDSQRHDLQKQVTDILKEFNEAKKEHKETKEILGKLEATYQQLEAKDKVNHILSRINEVGRQKVLSSQKFLDQFQDKTPCDSVVVSIDIRKSTELMLKARKPELFSEFITELSHQLSTCIIENFGIFDKFTGDGILAFFPKFYSGEQAIIRAIKAATECHQIFNKHYNDSRHCFSVFIKDVGLGIGIDYGNVTLLNSSNELTVVGIPVVYACRMSGAQAGTTILNQPAKEEVERLSKVQTKFVETEINIKNEGVALAYMVELNKNVFESLVLPNWADEEPVKEQQPS
jgi:class 3 adenylate cyclase